MNKKRHFLERSEAFWELIRGHIHFVKFSDQAVSVFIEFTTEFGLVGGYNETAINARGPFARTKPSSAILIDMGRDDLCPLWSL